MKRFVGRTGSTGQEKTGRHRASKQSAVLASMLRLTALTAMSGGLNGAVNSMMITWTNPMSGMPDSVTGNVVNCSLTGLMSGFMAGFTGVISYRRKVRKAAEAAEAAEAARVAEAGAIDEQRAQSQATSQ